MKKARVLGLVAAIAATVLMLSPWGSRLSAAKGDARALMIGEGVAWFLPAGVDEDSLPPSLALVEEPAPCGPVPDSWLTRPEFEVSPESYSAVIRIKPGTSLYGTGEIAGPLLRNGRVSETWNTDAWGYGARTRQLYQSHPWVLAVREDGSSYGILADTTFRCRIDLRGKIEFSTWGRPFPVIVIEGESPQEVLQKLAGLIGTITMPPRWALGYHQCRYSYYPDSRVKEIADEFRNRQIPCDVIWLDIHYMDGYRIFTFHPERFPDPKGVNDYLHSRGFKSIWMIDPGVKKEPGYFVYDQGTAGDHWVLTGEGEEFNGNVWPGSCAFPDFTRPETRAWWASLYKDFMAQGVDGVWNDMNEPSVFKVKTRTMPEDNLHRGGGVLPAGQHAQYHNVFGMLMVRATRRGIMEANPDRRPFVLTRANYLGGHRYAATWTGDNLSTWRHLRYSVSMIMNLGLSGQPFAGPDIGGFAGAGSPPMFARWFGIGVFFPFARGHTANGNIDKEPWAFGLQVEESCRTALERRYRLLPYYYTLFREASLTGMPVMRPLFFADPQDPDLRDEDDAFLIGSDLMVLAQVWKSTDYDHALPTGIWRTVTLRGDKDEADDNQPELRIRGGAIIPLGRVVQNTTEESLDPLTLLVCLDESGRARGKLYEDAGDGWAFREGKYRTTWYTARKEGDRVIVEVSKTEGDLRVPDRKVAVELVTASGVKKAEGTGRDPIVIDVGHE